ncbi:MAG: 30S ribosome-binding factor RbfA [Hyphomicrobiales bacterium]
MKAPSQRQLRVGELIRHALSEVLMRGLIREPALETGLISVSEVRMSPDLKIATVFIAPIGPGDSQALVKAMANNAGALRHEVTKRVSMKFAPNLRFKPDTSFDTYGKIDAILRSPEVARDTDPHRGTDLEQDTTDGPNEDRD